MSTPVLYLVAGPNGAGKSTFVDYVLRPAAPRLEFVNADEIERLANLTGENIDSYEASQRAAARRDELMDGRSSFITETVFSHPSKVELVEQATGAGYLVSLHVMLIPLTVAAARVAERAEHGGHGVPVEKMEQRYARLWPLVAEAIGMATESTAWDSSGFSAFTKVATFAHGRIIGAAQWPAWAPAPLVNLG